MKSLAQFDIDAWPVNEIGCKVFAEGCHFA